MGVRGPRYKAHGSPLVYMYSTSSFSTSVFSNRRASVHTVGSSGILLRHPDRSVWLEPLQQEPDGAPPPRGGLRYGRGQRQPGQLRPLERAQRVRPQPCPRQDPSLFRASVQCSRYVKLSMSVHNLGAQSLSPGNGDCTRPEIQLHPQGG